MKKNKRLLFPMAAVVLCLAVGLAPQAMAESMRSGDEWQGHVSVGPAGCDYNDLQSAIDDGAAGAHGGHIGVYADYEMTGEYIINEFADWVDDPWIVGGFGSCNVGDLGNAPSQTTLDADDQSRHFEISYDGGEEDPVYRVRLQNFELVNGNSIGGGALWIHGQHNRLVVELVHTEIDLNDGGFLGGGIHVSPDPTIVDTGAGNRPFIRPMLEVDEQSHITRNSAVSGGGISCTAASEDDITGTVVRTGAGLILDNTADLNGGGIYAKNCNYSIRNGGEVFGFIPIGGIAFNEAGDDGGGIYAEDGASIQFLGESVTFGGDPDAAGLLYANEAERGGAIYATGEDTEISLLDTALISNSADFGGGVYVTSQATVEFATRTSEAACEPASFDGGMIIIPPCNRLENNSANEEGGAAYVQDGASLLIHDTYIRNNSADTASIARVWNAAEFGDSPAATLEIENSLVHGNSEASTLIRIFNEAHVDVRWSTIADNEYPGDSGHKFTLATIDHPMEPTLDMTGVILWSEHDEVGIAVRGAGAGDSTLTCGIGFTDSPIGLTDTAFYSHIDPEFQNPESGNYRLSFTSPAIDYCNDQPVPERDLDGRVRDFVFGGDITEAPNSHPDGVHDIGAFTVQEPIIFHDRFEAD